jgi:DNA-directed RNA polymerase specialized sigma24 family protein
MKEKSSEELLEFIKMKDDTSLNKQAEDAFRVFTYRHQLELMKKLIPICKGWGYDEQVASELAYQTFERVWKYPKYDSSKASQISVETKVLFYLFGIAKRLLVEYKRRNEGEMSPFTGEEQIIYNYPNIDKLDVPIKKKDELERYYSIIKEALDNLSLKHRIIYLTYKQYESDTKNGFKLPRNLLTNLRKELNLTQNTIRSYKNEAFKEIKRKLESYEKQTQFIQ